MPQPPLHCRWVVPVLLALLAVLAAVPGPANSEKLDFDLGEQVDAPATPYTYAFGGYLESRSQLAPGQGRFLSARQRAHLELSASLAHLQFFANGNFDYDPAVGGWSQVVYPELDECRLRLDTEYLDIAAGNMIVRWGTGDGINPMDLFNPVDQRDPVANARSTKKRAVPMAQIVVQASPLTLEGVVLPVAAYNDPYASGSPWAPLSLRSIRQAARHGTASLDNDARPEGVECGLRASVTLRGWDVALLYYQGYVNDPVYAAVTDGQRTRYEARHPFFRAYGFNFAKGLTAGTLRGELAFKPATLFPARPAAASAKDGLVRTDLLEGVIGLDWTFLANLYVNAQYYFESLPGGNNGADYREFSHGMTFKVSDKFLADALEVGVQGTISWSGQGLSLESYGQYAFDDHWTLTLGAIVWEGASRSLLGQYDANDMVYGKLRYAF